MALAGLHNRPYVTWPTLVRTSSYITDPVYFAYPLLLTSHADRTSPVVRGKWILDNLVGSPPPPPPPDVPALPDARGAKPLTMRARMEQHRANPVCASCHKVMDPMGLALENFDAVGAWRADESGQPIDASPDS